MGTGKLTHLERDKGNQKTWTVCYWFDFYRLAWAQSVSKNQLSQKKSSIKVKLVCTCKCTCFDLWDTKSFNFSSFFQMRIINRLTYHLFIHSIHHCWRTILCQGQCFCSGQRLQGRSRGCHSQRPQGEGCSVVLDSVVCVAKCSGPAPGTCQVKALRSWILHTVEGNWCCMINKQRNGQRRQNIWKYYVLSRKLK